ncbi:MAG: cyclic nucleotide-binding domain-containing protein [Spirochaetota bacterium]
MSDIPASVPHLDRSHLLERLASIVPFRFLSHGELKNLVAASEQRRYMEGESLIIQGDAAAREVFVLLAGSVESVDVSRNPAFRMNVVDAVSYFGEGPALFGMPRSYEMRALEASTVLAIPDDTFLALLSASRPFAQALGTKLRTGLGLFDAFDRFEAEVHRGEALGHIEIRRLVEIYKALEPALHPLVADEARIDWSALAYAVRRLPENVTRCFVFLLTDNLPSVYASPELLFPFVPTEARHRFVYEMMPGKDMVLVRSGVSDIMDFLTCLSVFAVESRKIRYRLNHPDLILALTRLDKAEGDESAKAILSPFSGEEISELEALWPGKAVEKVREIVFHRQAWSVDVRKQINNYNGTLNELWSGQVGHAAADLMGMSPADFPDDIEVHIVSSNTHSVSNCLNPFFIERAGDILAWAGREGFRMPGWTDPMDEVYSLARLWLAAFPDMQAEVRAAEARNGIIRLPERVTTGIQVQLIRCEGVCDRGIDPGIAIGACAESSFIVNIDYAFGEQAEEIMRSLLLLFGKNVRTINIIGKAGGLQGARGDILAPTAFIEQATDAFQPLEPEDRAAIARLEAALPGRKVHEGPMLTVGGTLLQNRAMLHFYRRVWACVGLEMEGIWYLHSILEARELGVLRQGARSRFLYYVSDLPLSAGERLSARMPPLEGIPPLYATTRETLRGIFSGKGA